MGRRDPCSTLRVVLASSSLASRISSSADRLLALQQGAEVRVLRVAVCEKVVAIVLHKRRASGPGLEVAMREQVYAAVEEITDCPIESFLFDDGHDSDLALCVFVLGLAVEDSVSESRLSDA
jgi:hypothetical protein